MKARSLLPRRWREALSPTAQAAAALSPRRSTRAWSLEALEPRVLLSADPVLGAVHLALAPDSGYHVAADDAYHADAHLLSAAGPTMHALSVSSPQSGGGATVLHESDGVYTDASGFASAALQIDGAVSINITGTLGLGGNNTNFIAGNSSSTTDTLTLAATGNIGIHAPVSLGTTNDALSGLTITSAVNVTFDQDVEIKGNLTIDATGIVTFSHGITVGAGGSLTIRGATQLVLQGPVSLAQGGAGSAGNILLAADEIDFLGLASEQITGTGAVTLRPANVATPMAIFSPAGAATSGTLNLDISEMAAFAAGFSGFTFGYVSGGHAQVGAGAVLVGASTAPDSLVMQDSVSIYGGSITVADYSDPNALLRLGANDTLRLDAVNNITLSNAIEADHLALASASGKIQQTDSNVDGRTSEPLRALDLTASAATGVSLNSLEIHQLDVTNTGQGAIPCRRQRHGPERPPRRHQAGGRFRHQHCQQRCAQPQRAGHRLGHQPARGHQRARRRGHAERGR
ncbi:MAG: LEPR-XLL domain-containing protein [Burkholderiales bacterium]|nr:LEPR-XLL domain-containing protein [Burkholderiales bacterium]